MGSRKDWCDRMQQTITALAKVIVHGPGKHAVAREDERQAKVFWDMLKEEDCGHVVPLWLNSLGREIPKAAREKERKRILFYVKL